MMRRLIFLVFIFLLHLFLFSLASALARGKDLIARTCEQTPYYELCVSSLKSNPRSSNADVRGLAFIMFDTIKGKAAEALKRVDEIMGTKPQWRLPLIKCVFVYEYGILSSSMPQAIEALGKGEPEYAETSTSDAANEANACEENFKPNRSPLADLNKVVHDLSVVANSMVKML